MSTPKCQLCKYDNHHTSEHKCKLCDTRGEHTTYNCPMSCQLCDQNSYRNHRTSEHICTICKTKGEHAANNCPKKETHLNVSNKLSFYVGGYKIICRSEEQESRLLNLWKDDISIGTKMIDAKSLLYNHSSAYSYISREEHDARLHFDIKDIFVGRIHRVKLTLECIDLTHDGYCSGIEFGDEKIYNEYIIDPYKINKDEVNMDGSINRLRQFNKTLNCKSYEFNFEYIPCGDYCEGGLTKTVIHAQLVDDNDNPLSFNDVFES